MSSLSQFGGGAIKSIQRGTVAAGTGGTAVAITSVNTAKTELRFLGGVSGTAGDGPGYIVLTNATTITAYALAGTETISWELTERY